MREIKFRGKRKDTGVWVYGYVVGIHTANGNGFGIKDTIYHVNDGNINLIPEEVMPETIGQFTGLHDKNGKEIYEGDICKDNKGGIVIIEWNNDKFMFLCKVVEGGVLSKGLSFPLWQYNDCERNGYRYLENISDIHTNPELLKEVSHEA